MKQLSIFILGLFLGTSVLAQVPYPFVSTPIAEFKRTLGYRISA